MNITETAIIFINAIAMTFGFTGILYFVLHTISMEKTSFLLLYSIFYVVNVITSFVAVSYLPIVFFIVSFVFLSIKKVKFVHSTLSCSITMAIFIILMIVQNAVIALIVPSVEKLIELHSSIPYNICNSIGFIILTTITMVLLSVISKHINGIDIIRNVRNEIYNKKILYGFVIGIIICAIIISTIWYMSFINPASNNMSIIFGGALSIVLIVFTVLFIVIIKQTIEQKVKEIEIKKDKEIAELYKHEIQNMYDDVRDFKHDYMKIYSSMSMLIQQNNMNELKRFFENEIIPLQDEIISDSAVSHTITHIKDNIIQGVIYSYVLKARNKGINFSVDIQQEIPKTTTISSLDLSRVLSILLDNAFEAANNTSEKIVLMGIIKDKNQLIYITKNKYTDTPNITKIFSSQYSTKGMNHGRGLHIAKKICDCYDTVCLNINLQEEYFVSSLIISM